MVGKILLVLCAFASLDLVCPNPLTKEVDLKDIKSNNLAIPNLQGTNFIEEILNSVFGNFSQVIENFASVLQTQDDPKIGQLLDVINNGLGANLLVVKKEYVQVDPIAYYWLLTEKTRSLVKTVFPQSPINQVYVYGSMQRSLRQTYSNVLNQLEDFRVPVATLENTIALKGNNIVKRDLFSDIAQSIGIEVCNYTVTVLYSDLTNVLSDVTMFLVNQQINIFPTNGLGQLVTWGIDLVLDLINQSETLLFSLQSNLCNDLLSRNKRDVVFAENVFDETSKRDTAVRDVMTRDTAFWNIFSGLIDVLWGQMLAPIFNRTLKAFAYILITNVETLINNILNTTVLSFIYNIIDNIF